MMLLLQPNGIHFIKDSERLLEAFKLLKKKHHYSAEFHQLMDI
jgi:hypothetical protein